MTEQRFRPFKERRPSPGRKPSKKKKPRHKKKKPTPIQKRSAITRAIIADAKLENYRIQKIQMMIIKKFKQTKKDLEERLRKTDNMINKFKNNEDFKATVKRLRKVKKDLLEKIDIFLKYEKEKIKKRQSKITENIINKARE